MELPPTAVGKDWLPGGVFLVPSETQTGIQFSVYGLWGFTGGWGEGIDIHHGGRVFGVDFRHPAWKLPLVGRVGMKDAPVEKAAPAGSIFLNGMSMLFGPLGPANLSPRRESPPQAQSSGRRAPITRFGALSQPPSS